jgi:hypothetical protein
MKIFKSIISGAMASLKSWKGILITWFMTFILVSILAIPLNGALNSGFGNSMITEKLADGFNAEVFTDLGPILDVIVSFLSAGLIAVMFAGFIMNIFLTGGLFSSVRKDNTRFSLSEFFRNSAKNFWSFLIISLIMSLIILLFFLLLIALPLIEISLSDKISFKASIIIASLIAVVSIVIIPFLLLVTDYARAWQASNENSVCFKAIRFGFYESLDKFRYSYPLMLFVLLVQGLFIYLVLSTISGWRPVTIGGLCMLFMVSQFLFFIRIFLKVWRFGSVTAMMELN